METKNITIYKDFILSLQTGNTISLPTIHKSVELHQDNACSHTSQSTVNFLEKTEQEMGIKITLFTDTPAKSPNISITQEILRV